MSTQVEQTPLMRQYFSIKKKYPDALLLFRIGDFYEAFLEDAIKTSETLGIVLTKRANGSAASVELAGFPHHALDLYLPKLVKAGYRVAICDQLEDPKQAKGIVQRGVTELVTPGLVFSDAILDQKANNYLASIMFDKKRVGIAFLDLSTGEFLVAEGDHDYIRKLVQHFSPAELIFNKKQQTLWEGFTQDKCHAYGIEDWIFRFDYTYGLLITHFGTRSLKGFGIDNLPIAVTAAGVVLHYLSATEHKETKHIHSITKLNEQQHVWLDHFTVKALELISPQQPGGTALIEILDRTITPMGARLLKKWLLFPLKSLEEIQKRLSLVEHMVNDVELGQTIGGYLSQIGDIERLISKVGVGRVNPREMVALSKALAQMKPIQEALAAASCKLWQNFSENIENCQDLVAIIQRTLQEQPPLLTNQGGMIKPQVSDKLDALNDLMHKGKEYLVQLQHNESQRTHIPSLKIAYNRVFGYYLEVSNAHKHKVPTDWMRKQTLANAERYITTELKEYEENIVQSVEQAQHLEQEIYQTLVEQALAYMARIQKNAKYIAALDCYLAFAKQATERKYSKPNVDESHVLDLKGNRHPIIEQRLPLGTTYMPNDIRLDPTEEQILVITGPNMAGKSALLRQVALTVLMAQMGSFVPATSAHIGIIDKIFTRVGASDNLAQGESTFMVEMNETANIMHNLSNRSLVLMDEVGRGTSTYDGIAIAWALVEYMHNNSDCRPKTLFATHYHELNELAKILPRVKNYNVAVEEIDGKILFLHKIVAGGSAHSFGIHVAQMAGMPHTIVARATEILRQLSISGTKIAEPNSGATSPTATPIATYSQEAESYKQLKVLLSAIDINALSPLEGFLKLNEIKQNVMEPSLGTQD